jgi:D-alanine--poly(phosphoribitol) ligase subunit 2
MLIRDRLHVDVGSIDTDLFETGLIDSLAFVELLIGLEAELGVSLGVDDLDVEAFRTVRRISQLVDEHLRDGASHAP